MDGSRRVRAFLCHVREPDGDFVELVAGALSVIGVDSFFAPRDVQPTEAWKRVLERELTACDVLVAFLRLEFRHSEWTDHEVGIAIGKGKPVLAVKREPGLRPHGFLAELQDIDASSATAPAVAADIRSALWRLPELTSLLVRWPVEQVTSSFRRGQVEQGLVAIKSHVRDLDEATQVWVREALAAAAVDSPVIRSDLQLTKVLRGILREMPV